MNRGNEEKPLYETGEVRIGIQSPGDGWIKLDGRTVSINTPLGKRLLKAGQLSWTASQPALFIKTLAYSNGLWVAGGWSGGLKTSTDAVTWVTRASNTASNVQAIAYGNGLWTLAGNGGTIRTSTDAVTWVTRTSNTTTTIWALAYGNGLWVAGGYNGTLRTSTDGVTWVTQNSTFGTSWIYAVAYGNGLWVAGGLGGNMRSSTDGVTWVTQNSTFGSATIYGIAYGNNIFVAVGDYGNIRTSTDGVTWNSPTTNTTLQLRAVTYSNGIFLAAGYTAMTSTDGVVWVPQGTNFKYTDSVAGYTIQAQENSIAYGNGIWGIAMTANSVYDSILFSNKYAAKLPEITFGDKVYGWIKK